MANLKMIYPIQFHLTKNKNQNIVNGETNPNSTSLSINNNAKGTLIVKIIVNNKDGRKQIISRF